MRDIGLVYHTRVQCTSSFNKGCELCTIIHGLADKEFGSRWTSHKRITFKNISPVKSVIHVLRGTLKGEEGYINLYPFVKPDDPLSAFISRRPLHKDVKSPEVINAAKKLLHNCLTPDDPSKGHEECRYSRDSVLPTRVLRVSPNGTIKLHINEKDLCGSYIALSYCWGPNPQHGGLTELKQTNQSKLMEEIKMEHLEQTIQDAVVVTRQLGFEYLWVDRFCICQDDREDKHREFAKMATTYKNAVLTLAAGTAEAASQGFLNAGPVGQRPFLPEHRFEIPTEDGQMGSVYLSDRPYQPKHPLDTRGWTLQEFMLSSRMLIFSDYQLLWQCKQVDLQSVTGDEAGLEYQQHLESLPWAAFEDEGGPSFGAHDSDKLYLWKTILRQYTERNLSNNSDRLPAITGIIAELRSVWRDTAIYGHWKDWFIQLLVWYKEEDDRVEERYLKRAPSWSWASVDGAIRFEDPIERQDAKMDIVTAAQVTMSCRVVPKDKLDDSTRCQYFDQTRKSMAAEVKGKTLQYLFLGTIQESDEFENALALIAVEITTGLFRRVGLAVFEDSLAWEGMKHRRIELEPKHK
ncbi:uncharacterized protein FIESC28_11693 [Fusarium coffeatum]|uniref:Heterokaryon incompatibility domain-containing protein n=1 Tax=Fusarium coffeatum TaxID=231269 RepID=A0A366QFS4_9HYPO|nr:uncharacterized protein FIESC28_11693 [Fusarium coffeatum]RBR03771.1 hypothetical protein FIESC28_11693 [Fusarium coffeatum]